MHVTSEVKGALRDLLRAHVKFQIWLPALLVLVTAVTLGTLVREVVHISSGPVYIPPGLGAGVAYTDILSWAVPTVCAYLGGFILGRVYKARL